MKEVTEITRRRMSEAATRRCTPEWRKNLSDAYSTQLPLGQVKRMYLDDGLSQSEVAEVLGVSQKVIWRFMRNNGIAARPAVKRNQTGEANASWKGNEAGYSAFHRRLESLYGTPKACDACGTSDPSKRYDWANLTGRYEDPDDYKRMCRSCHWKHDQTHLNFSQQRPNKRDDMDAARRRSDVTHAC